MKRCDEKLYNLSKDVDNLDVSQFNTNENQINICYTNDTRRYINKIWNDKLKPDDALFIPADEMMKKLKICIYMKDCLL